MVYLSPFVGIYRLRVRCISPAPRGTPHSWERQSRKRTMSRPEDTSVTVIFRHGNDLPRKEPMARPLPLRKPWHFPGDPRTWYVAGYEFIPSRRVDDIDLIVKAA